MNAPILKLHIQASGNKMNKNNTTLTANEQINLRLDDQTDDSNKLDLTQQDNQLYYSLEDLFNLPEEQIKNNVFAVINPLVEGED